MTAPAIQLYLDEDVDVLVAQLLRARGLNVVTTTEAGRRRSSDEQQLAYAVAQQRTLLTHNRAHFDALAREYAVAGRTHHGIIMAVRRSPYAIARRVLALAGSVTAAQMVNQVRYV